MKITIEALNIACGLPECDGSCAASAGKWTIFSRDRLNFEVSIAHLPPATFNCPSCGGSVAQDSTSCPYCSSLLQTVACPACFGSMFLGNKFCPHCGARADLAAKPPAASHACPLCRLAMRDILVGGTPLEQCDQCGGLWIDSANFERICSDREAQTAAIGLNLPPPLPADDQVRYRPCPTCSGLMNRLNYAHRSGVIIDICRPHGIWLDRDELRRIIEFIRAGGLTRARQLEREELDRKRQQLDAQQQMPAIGGAGSYTNASFTTNDSADLLGGLAGILRWIIR